MGSITTKLTYPILPENYKNTIGDRLFYVRSKQNLTLTELSLKTGIHYNAINQIEQNLHKPKLDSLCKFATALNIPLWWLGCFEKLPEATIAEKIYKARMFRGLTRKQAAQILQCCEKSVFNWEINRAVPEYTDLLDDFLSIINRSPFIC